MDDTAPKSWFEVAGALFDGDAAWQPGVPAQEAASDEAATDAAAD